ncbi:MAG: class I SAM-dependent methyltransferase [Paracoccaceae bacterium]|nr:class I SAM-dependent methyltransferase [Paracoccaceae bacterium]
MTDLPKKMKALYTSKFEEHGPTPEGVYWGPERDRFHLRFEKMLALIPDFARKDASILDVGCGFAGLLEYARKQGCQLNYTGIDLAKNMVDFSTKTYPDARFHQGNILDRPEIGKFDYVVGNGILALKLDMLRREMDAYAHSIIRAMFSYCRKGIAFNTMTDRVNFHADNLYYRNPQDLLTWCMNELSPYVKLDHAYPLHEYTIYVYREPF